MRTMTATLVIALAMAVASPAMAQTRADQKQTDRSMSVTIDLATVGGGLLALVTASGLVNMYNAGAMVTQGTSFVEAMEVGAGLPVPAAILAILLGGYYGQDIVKQAIAPLMGSGEPVKAGH